jgi:predicted acylesterase/phospholipase RssA
VARPFLFRSYSVFENTRDSDFNPRNWGANINQSIWAVCRATTAAPTYFEPQLIDGEVFIDGTEKNPTMMALSELRDLHKYCTKVVASFGAGTPGMHSMAEFDTLGQRRGLRRLLNDARNLPSTLKELMENEKTHECVHRLAKLNDRLHYFRLNVQTALDIVTFDECKTIRDDGNGGKCSTFDYIQQTTDLELKRPQTHQHIHELARRLVEQRRRRIKDDIDRWERFTCCTLYTCSEEDCRFDGELLTFALRRDLKEHLQTIHASKMGEQKDLETKLDQCRKLPAFSGGPF